MNGRKVMQKFRIKPPNIFSRRFSELDTTLSLRNVRLLVPWTIVCGALWIGWSTGDFEHFPDYAKTFLGYRVAAAALGVVISVAALRATSTLTRLRAVWCWFLVWGTATALMIPDTEEYVLSHAIVLFVLQWASSSFMLWRWQWGFTNSLALLAIGELAISQIDVTGYNVDAAHGYLFTGVLVNVTLAKTRYDAAKREFDAQRKLARTSEDLATALEKANQVDKLKSEFFANISHELRTPLTLIIAPVDEMLSKMVAGPERDTLKIVKRNAARLLRMIEDLLDLARLEGGGMRLRVSDMDLGDLAKRVSDNIRPTCDAKGIDLSFAVVGDSENIFGDAHRVEIILTNLLGNAVKFTPKDGRISVQVFIDDKGGRIEVADTGPGIAAELLSKIFERFYQVQSSERRKHGGAGIGLALAKELAELHGGSLAAQSELGRGSTFKLFIPAGRAHFSDEMIERRNADTDKHPSRRAEDRATMAAPAVIDLTEKEVRLSASSQPEERILLDRGRMPRVLVAEDEDDLRAFIMGVLETQFEVVGAKDGAEALEKLEEARPDLVLTDVMMPGVSGMDLCRAIKENPVTRAIPVILLTALGESQTALEGYGAGADDFVAKPFHTKVLMARICAHLKMRSLALRVADQARLASAGTLAEGLAHEVKNPINAILNAAKVLESGGSSKVPNEKLLKLILDGVRRIDAVVSALNAHARPADGMDLAGCNVREGLDATLRLLAYRLNGIEVHTDIKLTESVFAAARAFNQVLMNLLDNAIRSEAKNLWVSLNQNDRTVQVTVADDGPGVPADIVERIFDPFFTTRPEGVGTGLGLHLSRTLARDCGGELRYETRQGGGAKFVLEVPAMERTA